MKSLLISIMILVFFPGISLAAEPWTKQDVILESTWQAIHLIDWSQTRQVARDPDRYHEHNPIIGRHPSQSRVDLYMATSALLHLGVTHFLPAKYRPYFQGITIGLSGACVVNNFSIGLGLGF